MDVKIRNLLALSHNNEKLLDEAFDLLRSNESRPAIDGPDLFSHDLFVLCAESAVQQGKILMARDALKMYFGRIPPQNQFLGRAYLVQAQLLAPESSENIEQLEKAVVFLLRAIKFAKENPRYHFIVYNASVLYWTFCRPFLRPGYKKYLAPSLLMVSRALDDTKDPDYEWRGTLMIALIESLLEASKFKDAIDVSTNAASFTKRHVPHLFKEVFRLQIIHDLVELPFLYRASRASGDLNCFYRLQKFRAKVSRGDMMSDPKGRLIKCLDQIMNRALDEEEDDEEESAISDAGKVKLGRKPATRPVAKVTKTKTPASGGFHATSDQPAGVVDDDKQPELLIELFRICMEQSFYDLAEMALDDLKNCTVLTKANEVEIEVLDSELMLKKLGDNEESYRKDVIQLRHKLVERIEQAISNAIRLDDRDLVQAACTTLWNTCLPLLQSNLRHMVRRPLNLLASTLEDIQSLLRLMRCQVHTELAKCEEDVEQNLVAIEHIKKAMALDDDAQYLERHENSLQRLQMRMTLYQTPEDPLLLAAQIIEQASSTGSGTMTMRRAHLMKAGQALSPDAFSLVIEAESFNKVLAAAGAGQIGVLALTQPLGTKAVHYNTYIEKTQGHLKRVGNEQDRIRVRLWADLAKTARKQGVWDICRVACRFCLLYDDGRWQPQKQVEEKSNKRKAGSDDSPVPGVRFTGSAKTENSSGSSTFRAQDAEKAPTASGVNGGSDDDKPVGLTAPDTKRKDDDEMTVASTGAYKSTLYDKDLLRILAETNFLYGEALVQLIRSEGLELNDTKSYPDDKSKRPKGYIPPRPDQDKNWIEYTNWISSLHSLTTQSFLRAADIGVELREAWIVQSAVAYTWNYNSHMLSHNRHTELVEPFEHLYEALKEVGFENRTSQLVNLCTALSVGLIAPWMPRPAARPNTASTVRGGSSGQKNRAKGGNAGGKKEEGVKIVIEAKGMDEIRKAITICDFAMKVTNGEVPRNEVPLTVRQPLLNVWLQAKQLASQSIGKGLGCDDDDTGDGGQKLATRVMVAMEMSILNLNGLFEFKECPTQNELFAMASACKWSDRNIQMQIWARLAALAYDSRNFDLSLKCTEQAFAIENDSWLLKLKRNDRFKYTVFYEMLSNVACLRGQCLRQTMHGNNPIRRQALENFLNACRHGSRAKNYELIMTAARHYWNTALPLVNSKLERELLQESLQTILKCINDTVDKEKERLEASKSDYGDEAGDVSGRARGPGAGSKGGLDAGMGSDGGGVGGGVPVVSTQANVLATMLQPADSQKVGDPSEDLTLRAAMYGVLFLSFIDKKDYEGGLSAMDEAVSLLPRTKHRLLIFKHRVMAKAKLGQNVSADIAKFKDESEDYVAYMWRRVALSSKKELEQLTSFQNSIEALTLASHDWQKVDYLYEFGEWLFVNEYPIQDSVDVFDWAINILLNMKFDLPRIKSSISVGKNRNKSTLGGKSTSKSEVMSLTGDQKPTDDNQHLERSKIVEEEEDEEADNSGDDAGEDVFDAAQFIPIIRKAEIGTNLHNLSMTLHSVNGIIQLEMLMRGHVMLASVVGLGSQRFNDSILMAYMCVMRIWQVSLQQTVKAREQRADAKGGSAKKGGKPDKKKDDGKDKGKAAGVKAPAGPVDTIPCSFEEWSLYEMPEDIRQMCKDDVTGFCPNALTFSKPMLTIHYLLKLTDFVREIQMNYLAFPILALAIIISRDIMEKPAILKLVKLKMIQVCNEINLLSSATYHETSMGPIVINEEEQAEIRTQLTSMEEKFYQVMLEERRMKESRKVMIEKSNMTSKTKELMLQRNETSVSSESNGSHELVFGEPLILSGRKIGDVVFYENWIETARFLVDQCQYQSARQFLVEAHSAGKRLDDPMVQRNCLQLLSLMALKEGNPEKAIHIMEHAQGLGGDPDFWFSAASILVECTLMQTEDKSRYSKARMIINIAREEFNSVSIMQPNKRSSIEVLTAKLELKLAAVEYAHIMESSRSTMRPNVHGALLSIVKKLEQTASVFSKAGKVLDEIYTVLQICKLYRRFAGDCDKDEDSRNDYLLKCQSTLREECLKHQQSFHTVLNVLNVSENEAYNLPYSRAIGEMQLLYIGVLLDLYTIHVNTEKHLVQEQRRKPSLVQFVEEFQEIEATPQPVEDEEDLDVIIKSIPHKVQMFLQDTLINNSRAHPTFRAKVLLLSGKFFSLQGLLTSPEKVLQWNLHEMNLPTTFVSDSSGASTSKKKLKEGQPGQQDSQATVDPTVTSMASFDNPDSSKVDVARDQHEVSVANQQLENGDEDIFAEKDSELKKQKQARILSDKRAFLTHKILYAQATEMLAQSVQVALLSGDSALAGSAALEMVETVAQYDANVASQYLALHQSCVVSEHGRKLLQLANSDTSFSFLHALLRQNEIVEEDKIVGGNTLLSKAIKHNLSSFEAWRRSEVKPNHLEFTRDYPNDVIILVIQHSPDKKFMYVGLLDKPKGKDASKSKQASHSGSNSLAKIFRVNVSHSSQLLALLDRVEKFQVAMKTYYLQRESRMSQQAYQARLMQALSGDDHDFTQSSVSTGAQSKASPGRKSSAGTNAPLDKEECASVATSDWKEEETKQEELLQTEFEQILEEMEAYLNPVTQLVKTELRNRFGNSTASFMLVMLADMNLLRLPLEALSFLREIPNISGFSRDFSLQMFHNRYSTDSSEDAGLADEGKDKKGGKGDKAAGGKAVKTQKESKRPQAKAAPLDRDMPAGYQGVDVHAFSYVVDPLKEAGEYDEDKPNLAMQKYLNDVNFQNKFLPRWMGVVGDDRMPTNGDWLEMMKDCNAFLYYGLENLFSYISVDRLLPIGLSECQFLILLDRVQSYPSYKRVSKENVNKTETQLLMEQPINVSFIMSLIGCGSIMLNQWFCKSQDNRDRFDNIMKYLIEQGLPTGKLEKYLCYPSLLTALEKTKSDLGGARRKSLAPAAADAAPPEAPPPKGGAGDRAESKSGKSRDGKAQNKPQTGSDKSRPDSSGKEAAAAGSATYAADGAPKGAHFEPDPPPPVIYSNFNMVLYGLPCMIIT